VSADSSETARLLRQTAAGDKGSWGALLTRHEERLRHMIAFRLARRLQGWVEPSDILQEACLDAVGRLPEYHRNPSVPFFLWLWFLISKRLVDEHRRHLGGAGRDAGREISLYGGALPKATSAALAARLLGRLTTPSQPTLRAERQIRLKEALNSLDPIDREVLAVRHFEQLTVCEAAAALSIEEKAAGMRYVRALRRFKEILTSLGNWAER
jgi:RNA polymerase sigma-70 factor (ECF subfamily)